jgi:transcriptional regulator with XRE-family HTH domain
MAEHIGLTIKELREGRKLSKARLAREAGFSDAYLVQIEKGDRTPSTSVLLSIAKALRVPPHQLLLQAGYYTDAETETARTRAEHEIARIEAERNGPLLQEERDRLYAVEYDRIGLERSQEEYYADPAAWQETETAFMRENDPLALTSDEFWQWDKAASWAPEHWNDLSDRDRRLVQQLINRLIELGEKA